MNYQAINIYIYIYIYIYIIRMSFITHTQFQFFSWSLIQSYFFYFSKNDIEQCKYMCLKINIYYFIVIMMQM